MNLNSVANKPHDNLVCTAPSAHCRQDPRILRKDWEGKTPREKGCYNWGEMDIVSKAKAKKGKKKALCYRKEARIDRSRIERCIALHCRDVNDARL